MKILVSLLGWVPIVGTSIKLAYVGNLVNEAILHKLASQEMNSEKADKGAEYFEELAGDFYDEHLKLYVDELGLPDFATNKAKDKALTMIADKLKEKYSSRVHS